MTFSKDDVDKFLARVEKEKEDWQRTRLGVRFVEERLMNRDLDTLALLLERLDFDTADEEDVEVFFRCMYRANLMIRNYWPRFNDAVVALRKRNIDVSKVFMGFQLPLEGIDNAP